VARTEDEESDTSIASRSSVASSPPSRGKKRKLAPPSLPPDISEKLLPEIGTSSSVDVSAEHARQVAVVMKVAVNSTNLKGTYIRDLKNAAAFFSAAWRDRTRKRSGEGSIEKTARDDNVVARLTLLEEENAALRQELANRPACTHECIRYAGQPYTPRDNRGARPANSKGYSGTIGRTETQPSRREDKSKYSRNGPGRARR
jgi:hypothetical protein